MPAEAAAAGAAGGASGFNPWMALAMGGSSILEAIINKLFFGPPKSVRRLTRQVAEKGSELIESPGYSEDVIRSMFGKNFQGIRGQKGAMDVGRQEAYGRAGMTGTGAEIKAARKDAWQNENLVTEAMRDLMIAGEAKKSSDIQLATQMLGQASGSAQAFQGQGPALTEMLISSLLMNQRRQPALQGNDWAELFDNYGAANSRGSFGTYNFGSSVPGNPDAIWNG